MQRMKADHDCAQKHKLLQDRNAFDSVAARNIAEETCPEGTHRYLWGVSYAPSTTIAVLEAFEEIDQNDACFMHHETQGIMLSTVTRDAGQQTVHIASSLFLDAEREGPWQLHNTFILETYAGFDSKRRRRIADLNNGLMRSIEDHLNEGSLFLSSDHQKEHVEKRGGQEGIAHYLEAVKCATTDQV